MSTAMQIAGVTPDIIKRFTAKPGATVADKAGEVAVAEGNVLSRWIDVTPEIADRWLKANFRNRPIKDDVVAAYARDMVNGVWRATHQGIAFNDRDELIDGQHRLRAVIKAKRTVRMLVTFGLASKIEGSDMTTMDCVDRGCTRSVSDQLKIQHGLKQGTQIAQVCTALAHLCVGERMRRLSVDQTLRIYKEFQAGVDFVIENRSKQPGLRSAGVLGAFAFAQLPAGEHHNIEVRKMFLALNNQEQRGTFRMTQALQEFLTGANASLLLASMNRSIAELTVWTIWMDKIIEFEKAELAKESTEWLKAVEYFRDQQRERVAKVAKFFALPKGEAAPVPAAKATATSAIIHPQSSPAPAKPSLERLMGCVEVAAKLSKFILTGRGNDGEIERGRALFVVLAFHYGYTSEAVALALHKPLAAVGELNLPREKWTGKFTKQVESVQKKLA